MQDQQDIPSVREEVARKTFDELERLSQLQVADRITAGEFALCARTVWNVVSGLVDDEHMELVQRAADEFPTPTRRVHWLKDGNVFSFIWDPEKDDYALLKRGASYPTPEVSRVRAHRIDRKVALDQLFAACTKAGWTRL